MDHKSTTSPAPTTTLVSHKDHEATFKLTGGGAEYVAIVQVIPQG